MACQLLINRAVARNFAKNEKKENSVGESLGRFLFSLVRQFAGEVEESDQRTSRPAPAINTVDVGTRRYSSHETRVAQSQVSERSAERNNNISSVRRSLLDSVLRRVTNKQASHLRRKAFDQLTINGNSAPFLALVGVSLGESHTSLFLSSHNSSVSQLQGRELSPRRTRSRASAVRSDVQ